MCTSLIEAKFNKTTTKLLELGGVQAVVLLAFNDSAHQELSFEQLLGLTGLDAAELRKQLISLSMLEHQILTLIDDSAPLKMLEAGADAKSLMMSKKKSIKKTITNKDVF